ncbi:MAG: hypothetical protein MOIL_00988 [Candidatus Methanolliviera sp. GoM_oil]|nr:MAG: hypothetical protein MOIL_00988 [Candidatus Methanolliviera sp. GoM_oil]
MKKLIALSGSDGSDETLTASALKTAEDVGYHIAEKCGILICGGKGEVMKAAKRVKRGGD